MQRHRTFGPEQAHDDDRDPARAGLARRLAPTEVDQTTIEQFIAALIARSSLIVALYWRRRDALCESNAHHALVAAISDGDATLAEELMTSHLVDLRSCLDLSDRPQPPRSLREALS